MVVVIPKALYRTWAQGSEPVLRVYFSIQAATHRFYRDLVPRPRRYAATLRLISFSKPLSVGR